TDFGQPRAIALNATAVFLAGDLDDQFTVVALEKADGSERWRRQESDLARATAVAVDPAGDVVAAGFKVNFFTTPGRFVVIKWSAADGTEVWRYETGGEAFALTVDGDGDVIAAGELHDPSARDLGVVKLDGATGTEIWRRTVDDRDSREESAHAVVVDP